MNKKLTAAIAAAAAVTAMGVSAMAADVSVKVNGAVVDFEDQSAVIENDRTLVPARGVFEAMGASVKWDGDKREVTVTSPEGTTVATLVIDSADMNVKKYTSLFDFSEDKKTLDVPAKIINDRTMIPLRAVAEAMDAQVDWDGEAYVASIERGNVFDVKAEKRLGLALTKEEGAAQDEVVVCLNVTNMDAYPEMYIGGVTLGLNYDPNALEYVSTKLYAGDLPVENSMGADNPDFTDTRLKSVHITIDEEHAMKEDGVCARVTFNKKSDAPSEVSVSKSYHSRLGFDTQILLCDSENKMIELDGADLVIGDKLIIE